ncbi:ABC transporter ATP-binding protein [Commensalibacter nepenthis]|uniref:ABC transporter ATP-binding protein n=1 Tax=Commensalibacter nepenthis TaxID=3043872 RepID=A0ABT6QAA3_9PROT|nr:ABC transporter ATP-binding protein [Commensalibacter sp. TBRC 10068]MDI2113841.1 ABC transporter ATP-binding protein [Commensalibacter sp. TBRC 10068]
MNYRAKNYSTDILTSNAVYIKNLTKKFNEITVLNNIHLSIPVGQFTVLLGPSGSGKTTLLRILADLDNATSGFIEKPEKQAVIFQESRLLPWKKVWQNVVIGLDIPNAKEVSLKILREVNLEHRADAWPRTLSGGEAQRVGIARALIREPAFLMLDEPFAALDALTKIQMRKLIIDLWKKHNCAVLLISHDIDDALLMADHVIVLNKGTINYNLDIPWNRENRRNHPEFEQYRLQLLSTLGVQEF